MSIMGYHSYTITRRLRALEAATYGVAFGAKVIALFSCKKYRALPCLMSCCWNTTLKLSIRVPVSFSGVLSLLGEGVSVFVGSIALICGTLNLGLGGLRDRSTSEFQVLTIGLWVFPLYGATWCVPTLHNTCSSNTNIETCVLYHRVTGVGSMWGGVSESFHYGMVPM